MWGAVVTAVLAASATGLRFYVDRRVGELSSGVHKARDEDSRRRLEASESELEALRNRERESQQRHEAAEKELALIKAKSEPRSLPAADGTALTAHLRSHPSGIVVIKASVNAPDARSLADQFASALQAAGWTVRVDNALFAGPDTTGIWITIKDRSSPPEGAGILQRALKAVGFDARGQFDPAMQVAAGEFWLCVGKR
jgi:hypothetical protein